MVGSGGVGYVLVRIERVVILESVDRSDAMDTGSAGSRGVRRFEIGRFSLSKF